MSVITDAVGLTDSKGAKKAQQASTAMTAEQLAFEKEQYAEWKAVYGPLQEDLGTYFKNLTGDQLSAPHIQAIQEESQVAQAQIDQSLAQRGIGGGGLEASLASQNLFQTGMRKAEARALAPQQVKQQQMGFLGLGLGQGAQLSANMAQTSASGASSLADIAAGKDANTSSVLGTGIGAAAAFFSDKRLKKNIRFVSEVNGIRFYDWEWNTIAFTTLGYAGTSFGVIAQELIDILPDAVNVEGEYMSVDYKQVMDYIKDNV